MCTSFVLCTSIPTVLTEGKSSMVNLGILGLGTKNSSPSESDLKSLSIARAVVVFLTMLSLQFSVQLVMSVLLLVLMALLPACDPVSLLVAAVEVALLVTMLSLQVSVKLVMSVLLLVLMALLPACDTGSQ